MIENQKMDRRKFLSYLGTGAAALAASSAGLGTLEGKASAASKTADHLFGYQTNRVSGFFESIQASDSDQLVLPKGYQYDVVAAFDDVINSAGDKFGQGADYNAYLPINGSNSHGLLVTNHENTKLFLHGDIKDGKMTAEQIRNELYYQGMSVIEVKQGEDGVWKMDTSSKYARRINGFSKFELTGPARGAQAVGSVSAVTGTFANCSGGVTLWNTVMSCEENFEATSGAASLNATHYGSVVEIDPFRSPESLIVVCTSECPEYLPAQTRKVVLGQSKADVAFELMNALLQSPFSSSEDQNIALRVFE